MKLYEQSWPEGEYRLLQLGFVVDDLFDGAARWARVFGVGPFHVLPRSEQPCTYRGVETGVNVQIAVAQAGPAQIELIRQYCDRPSVYRELAASRPCGFHQLCTVTRDYEGKRGYYEELGYALVSEMVSDGQHVAYYDTVADFGFYTEVVEETSTFLGHLTNISKTCAEWDGRTDPVRILTRDGYRLP